MTQRVRHAKFPLIPGVWEGRFRLKSDEAPSDKIWLSYNDDSGNMDVTSDMASAVRVRFKESGSRPHQIFLPVRSHFPAAESQY